MSIYTEKKRAGTRNLANADSDDPLCSRRFQKSSSAPQHLLLRYFLAQGAGLGACPPDRLDRTRWQLAKLSSFTLFLSSQAELGSKSDEMLHGNWFLKSRTRPKQKAEDPDAQVLRTANCHFGSYAGIVTTDAFHNLN